jgi:hypothetical protein
MKGRFVDQPVILFRRGVRVTKKVTRGTGGRRKSIPFSKKVTRGTRCRRKSIPFSQEVPRGASGLTRAVPRDSLRKLVRMTDLVCRKLDGRTKAGDRDPNETRASGWEDNGTRGEGGRRRWGIVEKALNLEQERIGIY